MRNLYLLLSIFILLMGCKNSKENKNKITENTNKIYVISNDSLKVSVKSFGAELTSIKKASTEYLWQGNPEFWKHQSPILFPIVGRLLDHEYTYKDALYKMNFHGFAGKSNFTLVEKTQKSIILELNPSEVTRKQYPFNFKLQIKYVLKGNKLEVHYSVLNPSEKEDLYFSIGGHPALNIPLEKHQKRNEYQLVFDTDAMPTSRDKENGLFIDSYTQFFKEPGILKIQDTLFKRGALVFNPNPFSKTTLVYQPTQKKVFTISFKDFPYLGIWSAKKPTTPFICIEPWYGIAENIHHNKEFTQKEGIQILKSQKEFHAMYSIEVY